MHRCNIWVIAFEASGIKLGNVCILYPCVEIYIYITSGSLCKNILAICIIYNHCRSLSEEETGSDSEKED